MVNGIIIMLSSATGQALPQIIPTVIEGQAGENVSFSCISPHPNEAVNNYLEYLEVNFNVFVTFRDYGRLTRSDVGSFSNFTFGPLRSSDSGLILRCTNSLRSSSYATIHITCELYITTITLRGA